MSWAQADNGDPYSQWKPKEPKPMNDIQKAIDSIIKRLNWADKRIHSLTEKEKELTGASELKSLLEQVAEKAYNEGLATDEMTPWFFEDFWDDLNLTFNEE